MEPKDGANNTHTESISSLNVRDNIITVILCSYKCICEMMAFLFQSGFRYAPACFHSFNKISNNSSTTHSGTSNQYFLIHNLYLQDYNVCATMKSLAMHVNDCKPHIAQQEKPSLCRFLPYKVTFALIGRAIIVAPPLSDLQSPKNSETSHQWFSLHTPVAGFVNNGFHLFGSGIPKLH